MKFTTESGTAARKAWQKKYQKTFQERLWSKISKSGPNECWNWTGCKTKKGYGMILANGERKYIPAHRAVWIESNGKIQIGIEICHKCDNPSCCNPNHLFSGTHKENMSDCAKKKRFNPNHGEHQHAAKLTNEKIKSAILDMKSGKSYRAIANKYGVSATSIHRAITGRSWKHIHQAFLLR